MRTTVVLLIAALGTIPFPGILGPPSARAQSHARPPDVQHGIVDDRAIIERIVHDSIGWALTKNRARLESILAHDEDLFIFHPNWNETIVGWDAFVPLFDVWMDPRFVATHMDVRDLRIHFSRSGDVAWYSAILEDCGTWDGQEGCWKDTRWSGVLERREETWVIVQMHFSFAADKVREAALAEQAAAAAEAQEGTEPQAPPKGEAPETAPENRESESTDG